ncbi:MAG: hypothetical protein ACOYMG_12000 [Candidatus Methylumidiphilus sp.]
MAVVIYALSIERQAAEVTLSVGQLGQHIDMLRHAAALEPAILILAIIR